MIIDEIRHRDLAGWRVALCQASYRPERRFVKVACLGPSVGDTWCVGFADTSDAADMLFDAVVRSLLLAIGGNVESVDWMELPEGMSPLD